MSNNDELDSPRSNPVKDENRQSMVQGLVGKIQAEMQAGDLDSALLNLQQLHELAPDNTECIVAIAQIHQRKDRDEEAVDWYRKLLDVDPDSIVGHAEIGMLYCKTRAYDKAISHLETVVEERPDHLGAQENLGLAYASENRVPQAKECFRKVLDLHPNSKTYANLAGALLMEHDTDSALEFFSKANQFFLEESKTMEVPAEVRLNRVVHDYQQIEHLKSRGLIDSRYDKCAGQLKALAEKAGDRRQESQDVKIRISGSEFQRIAPAYKESIFPGDASELDGVVINPDLDRTEIERRWKSSHPEAIYIDDVLTEEAIEKLYRFFLEATVFKTEYGPGYLGAIMANGLASPLLFQITTELQARFPAIFAGHPLTQAWVFKYDAVTSGICKHADFAAVNLNLWLTPNDANLEPDGGGLLLWDKESPADWSFADYQRNDEKITDFLKESGANEIRIPYRRNRAAIFNSTLFHQTDHPVFRDRYEDRRLNLTLLFGHRLRV